jgi:hypothetical protein
VVDDKPKLTVVDGGRKLAPNSRRFAGFGWPDWEDGNWRIGCVVQGKAPSGPPPEVREEGGTAPTEQEDE